MYSNSYHNNASSKDINNQLLIGLKKHLLIAQDSSNKKEVRLNSLNNISEVLEYVTYNINESIPEEEKAILEKFFRMLLTKVRVSIINIHSKPETFTEEIAFISVLLRF